AVGDRGRDFGDVAHLAGEVRRHQVHVVGEVLPGSGNAIDARLTAELAFRSHFARHARAFAGKGVELIDHRVDGVLQLQNLAADIHGDLLREVAARHRRGHLGDVADLPRQVRSHQIYAVGDSLPRTGPTLSRRPAAKTALGTDLARHARHFAGKRVQLVHHRIDGVLGFGDLPAHVDG